jgi:hypothetical protein
MERSREERANSIDARDQSDTVGPKDLIRASLDGRISVQCVLCGKTSMEAKIDLFPLSPKARNMLLRLFGIDPDEALNYHGVCRPCLLLPVDERNDLAESAIKTEEDEFRRALIRKALDADKN